MTDSITRVPEEQMLPLELAAHTLGMDIYGIKCDAPGCGWSDMTVPLDYYAAYLTVKCPECGAPVMIMQDFTFIMSSLFAIAAAHKPDSWLGGVFAPAATPPTPEEPQSAQS